VKGFAVAYPLTILPDGEPLNTVPASKSVGVIVERMERALVTENSPAWTVEENVKVPAAFSAAGTLCFAVTEQINDIWRYDFLFSPQERKAAYPEYHR
jgi:hypothetical protein